MELKSKIKEYINLVDAELDKYLPPEENYPQTIYKAMRYSIFAGGKRLRPILVLAACEAVGGNIQDALPCACAVEMIHTFSLIHDDLPAIDNDDYRRGRLTNHKVFGDAMAVLAGDGLLNKATEVMLQDILKRVPNNLKYIKAMDELIRATGTEAMIAGEVVDIECEGKKIDADTLNFMHSHKTGALITASVRAGALIGDASDEQLAKLMEFSDNVGLAFQIRDDVLDIIGDQEKLGKDIGSDLEKEKATFPSVYGLERSQQMVIEVSEKAVDALDILSERGQFLRELTDYLINRES